MNNREFIESITLEGEEWRDVIGYEGLYMVSSFGRIFSKMKNRLLSPCKNSSKMPHLYIDARKNGCRTKLYIHRLVALAFIPNPKKYPEIDHIDCIPTNNHFSNLKWCNRKMNQNNPISLKHQYQNQPNKKPVVKLKNGTFLEIFPSLKSTSRRGYSLQAVWSCCNKRNKTHKGFEWMYLSDYETLTNMSKNALSNTNT